MRFAAIADIHGNALALEAVLADVDAQGIGDIVNLGDMLSGPPIFSWLSIFRRFSAITTVI